MLRLWVSPLACLPFPEKREQHYREAEESAGGSKIFPEDEDSLDCAYLFTKSN